MQSVSNRNKCGKRTTSRVETAKCTNDEDGEINASDTDNQENEIKNIPFKPSETKDSRTPVQPISIKNLDLDDTVIVNEDRMGEDYHMVTGATKSLFSQIY